MKVNLRHAAFSINVSGGGVGGFRFFFSVKIKGLLNDDRLQFLFIFVSNFISLTPRIDLVLICI